MKKLAIALLSITLISNSACGESGEVVATYSGGKVTSQEVMDQFKFILDQQKENKGKKFTDLDKKFQEVLVKNYITMKLIMKEADKLGITKSAEFQERLKNTKKQLIQQEIFQLKSKDAITQAAVDAEYKKIVAMRKGQKEIEVSHILVDSEKLAKEIKGKVFKGNSFEKLAKQYSNDDISKVKGGNLGYISKNMMVPEFEEKVFAMKKNEVSNPVKTNFGWHVIKVHNIRDIKMPKQSEVENELRSKLANDAIRKYLDDLEKSADIELKI
ncbi:MAG: hypothetical protein DGJ47_000491 [Rickettsiaceae bacterium]